MRINNTQRRSVMGNREKEMREIRLCEIKNVDAIDNIDEWYAFVLAFVFI